MCVTDNCNSGLVDTPRSVGDDVAEGFLQCKNCKASYPIIDGVPIIVDDFARYISQRTRTLGRWMLECKKDSMKRFLKQKSKELKVTTQNRYEEGGGWFGPYLSMHALHAKIDEHFSRIMNERFNNLYDHLVNLIFTKFAESKICLELGCATGTIARRIAKKQQLILGVDQSYSFVRETRKQNENSNLEFLVADSLKVPFKVKVRSCNLIESLRPCGTDETL